MATQSYISLIEEDISECKEWTDKAIQVYAREVELNCGKIYPENADHWNTLRVNAEVLRNRLTTLIELMDQQTKREKEANNVQG